MLFTKSKAATVALVASSYITSSQALKISFEEYFDFSLSLNLPSFGECSTSDDSILQIGINESLNLDIDLFKRELEQEADAFLRGDQRKRDSISVPKAALTVTDVAYVKNNLYKVTVNFETAAPQALNKAFAGEATNVKVNGLGVPEQLSVLVFGAEADAGIKNLFQWSATFVIEASFHNGLFCLPDDFNISFEFGANASSEALAAWKKYFPTDYAYTLDDDYDNAKSVSKRFDNPLEVQKRNEMEKRLLNLGLDLDVLLKIGTPSLKLPNFCWKKECITSTVSPAPSTTTVTPSSSSAVEPSTTTVTPSSSSTEASISTITIATSSAGPSTTTVTPASSSADPSSSAILVVSSSADSSVSTALVVPSTVEQSSSTTSTVVVASAEPSSSTVLVASDESSASTVLVASSLDDLSSSAVVFESSSGSPASSTVTLAASSTATLAASSTAPSNSTVTLAAVPETVSNVATTVVTITSCEDHKCTAIPVTTGLTTVTENETIYTTYCPLSTNPVVTASSSSVPATPAVKAPTTVVTAASSSPIPTPIETSVATVISNEEGTSTIFIETTIYNTLSTTAPATIKAELSSVLSFAEESTIPTAATFTAATNTIESSSVPGSSVAADSTSSVPVSTVAAEYVTAESDASTVAAESSGSTISAESNAANVAAESNAPTAAAAESNASTVAAESNSPAVAAESNVPSVSEEQEASSSAVPVVSVETGFEGAASHKAAPFGGILLAGAIALLSI